jgi:hypothetical protein
MRLFSLSRPKRSLNRRLIKLAFGWMSLFVSSLSEKGQIRLAVCLAELLSFSMKVALARTLGPFFLNLADKFYLRLHLVIKKRTASRPGVLFCLKT